MIPALDVAHYILKKSKRKLNNSHLQNYLYFVQLEFVAEFHYKLMEGEFESTKDGVLNKKVYFNYRDKGDLFLDKPPRKEGRIYEILKKQEGRIYPKQYLKNINKTIKKCDLLDFDVIKKMLMADNTGLSRAYKEKSSPKDYFSICWVEPRFFLEDVDAKILDSYLLKDARLTKEYYKIEGIRNGKGILRKIKEKLGFKG